MKTTAYYEEFAQRYDNQNHSAFCFTPAPFREFFAALPKSSQLLDLGCGPGVEAQEALKFGLDLTLLDSATEMLEIARSRVPNAKFILSDLCRTPFLDHSFDAVMASFSLVHCNDQELATALAEIWRVARPGAKILIASAISKSDEVEQKSYKHFGSADVLTEAIEFYYRTISNWTTFAENSSLTVVSNQIISTHGLDFGFIVMTPMPAAAHEVVALK